MRLLTLAAVLLWAVSAHAGGDCAADFSDCREDCTLMYGGSVKVSNKKKFAACSKKCTRKKTTCEERAFETKRNSLEAGSLDSTPTSRDVDDEGLPTRTTVSKTDDDAPVSTRTKLDKVEEPVKTADDDAPPPPPREEPKAEKPAPVREEKPAPREEPKVHPTEKKDPGDDLRDDGKRSSDDDDELRDDGPRKDRREKKRDPPKEEDHDDLRYY